MNTAIPSFSKPFAKIITSFAAVFYFALLFYIFFLARRRRGPALPWSKRHVNLIPFKNKYAYFISQMKVTHPQLREFYIDLFGNILLFIPFPFFLFFLLQIKDTRRILIISIMASASIEIIQFLFSVGVADIDDVILNTTGAAIGILLLKIVNRIQQLCQVSET